MTAPLEADKELDEILADNGLGAVSDADLAIRAKAALLAWRDKAVVAARIDELERLATDQDGHVWSCDLLGDSKLDISIDGRLSKLKAIMEIKE